MKKIITGFGIIFLFLSCASGTEGGRKIFSASSDNVLNNNKLPTMKEQAVSGHWITTPSENSIVIIGVSGLLVKNDDEISAAKEDAGRKAAMYHGVMGNIESYHTSGANFFDYIADSKVELNYDTDYEKYYARMTYDPEKDMLKTDNSVFIRFRYPVSSVSVEFKATMNDDGRPLWTYSRDLPNINGYITAVGFARNQVRLKDTIKKSTDAAVVRMIEDMSTMVKTTDKSISGTGAGSMIQTRSRGKVSNFQVLEYWIDPKTGYVYTLAIAKNGN